jgi:hypothetical protein
MVSAFATAVGSWAFCFRSTSLNTGLKTFLAFEIKIVRLAVMDFRPLLRRPRWNRSSAVAPKKSAIKQTELWSERNSRFLGRL